MSRQPNFIILNVVIPMACISLLGVTTFTIDLKDVQDRIAIAVALRDQSPGTRTNLVVEPIG